MQCPDCDVRLRVVSTERINGATYRYLRCNTCATKFQSIELFSHLAPEAYRRKPGTSNVIYTDDDIKHMRELHNQGKSRTYIADLFGSTPAYVRDVLQGRRRSSAT